MTQTAITGYTNVYTVTLDIVVVRSAIDDAVINEPELLIVESVATLSSLRTRNSGFPLVRPLVRYLVHFDVHHNLANIKLAKRSIHRQ